MAKVARDFLIVFVAESNIERLFVFNRNVLGVYWFTLVGRQQGQ
jgi:hypothetical protein